MLAKGMCVCVCVSILGTHIDWWRQLLAIQDHTARPVMVGPKQLWAGQQKHVDLFGSTSKGNSLNPCASFHASNTN